MTVLLAPPPGCLGSKLESLNFRVCCIPLEMRFGHFPTQSRHAFGEEGKKPVHWQKKPPDDFSGIDDNRKVRNTTERVTRVCGFFEVVVWDAHKLCFRPFRSAAALYGNSHNLLCVGVTGDNVDSRVIHGSALKTVLREPIKDQSLTEIPGDLRVSGALIDLPLVLYPGYVKLTISLSTPISSSPTMPRAMYSRTSGTLGWSSGPVSK